MTLNSNSLLNPEKADILIVDDTPQNLQILSRMLIDKGYEVRSVINGSMALMGIRSAPPDLILLDILMPGMDGYEVCEILKADEQTRHIPVIFLSALNEPLDKLKAFTVGGADYITKPFHLKEVLARVENQLNQQRLYKKLAEQNLELQQKIREREAALRDREQAEAALRDLNQELEAKVEARTFELKQANNQLLELQAELRQALTHAQEINDLKTRIITTVSHEYRTPLTSISFATGLLENHRKKLSDSQQDKYIKQIKIALKQLTNLVEDVIVVNQTEFENFTLQASPLDLIPIVHQIAEDFKTVINEDLYTFIVKQASEHIYLEADLKLLNYLLKHLLYNAMKFSPKGGKIFLGVYVEDNQVILEIKDEGIGIHPEDIPKICNSFYRGRNIKLIGGTGLGLTIVKKCVDLHQGSLEIKSQIEVGTTIRVSLPLSQKKSR